MRQFSLSINQSINQTSIAPISPAKPGSVARQPNQCSTTVRQQFRSKSWEWISWPKKLAKRGRQTLRWKQARGDDTTLSAISPTTRYNSGRKSRKRSLFTLRMLLKEPQWTNKHKYIQYSKEVCLKEGIFYELSHLCFPATFTPTAESESYRCANVCQQT